MLNTIIKSLEEEFPVLKKVFLDDRNKFMAQKILEEDFEKAVVVVGAAHVQGLKEELKRIDEGREQEKIPEKNKRF